MIEELNMFQFYDSAIKSLDKVFEIVKTSMFQFYDSAIKRLISGRLLNTDNTFQFYDSAIKSNPHLVNSHSTAEVSILR